MWLELKKTRKSNTVSSKASNGVNTKISNTVSSKAINNVSSKTSNSFSSKTSNTLSSKTSNTVSSKTSNTVGSKTGKTVSSKTSNTVGSNTSNTLSSKTSNTVSSKKSYTVSSKTSNIVSSRTIKKVENKNNFTFVTIIWFAFSHFVLLSTHSCFIPWIAMSAESYSTVGRSCCIRNYFLVTPHLSWAQLRKPWPCILPSSCWLTRSWLFDDKEDRSLEQQASH